MGQVVIRFGQPIIMTIFIVVFVSCSSLKQNSKTSTENSNETVEEVQSEWLECKASTDCVKVKSFCGLPGAVHKKYKDTFLRFVKSSKASVDCSRYKNINYESIVEAACEDKRCKLIIP